MEPKSELARYAFGYSDKKPGRLFWAIHVAMIAYIVYAMIGAAHANPFSDEVDCEDALAPMSAYGTERYANGQDYCMSRYDHDRKIEGRLKALENRDDDN